MASSLQERVRKLSQTLIEYEEDLEKAFAYVETDPEGSLNKCRRCTDRFIEELFQTFAKRELSQRADPLEDPLLNGLIGRRLKARLRFIRELGNLGSHADPEPLSTEDAIQASELLCDVLEWWSTQPRGPRKRRISGRLGDSSPDSSARHDVRPSPPDSSSPHHDRPSSPDSSAQHPVRPSVEGQESLPKGRWPIVAGTLGLALLTAVSLAALRMRSDGGRSGQVGRGGSSGTMPGKIEPPPPVLVQPPDKPVPRPEPVAGPEDSTWTRQRSGVTSDLLAVVCDSRGQVYAAGGNGTLLTSIDGGRIWSATDTRTKVALQALSLTADGRVFAVGEHGMLLLTLPPSGNPRDGMQFQPQQIANQTPLLAALGHSRGDLFVGGAGALLQLRPDGSLRKPLDAKAQRATIRDIVQWDERVLFAVGDNGTVLRGELRDGIAAWSAIPVTESGKLWHVARVGKQLLITGENESVVDGKPVKQGFILRSLNTRDFQSVPFPRPVNPIYNVAALFDTQVYAAAWAGPGGAYLVYSPDGGTSWDRQPGDGALAELRKSNYVIAASRLGDLYIVGPKGTILHKRVRHE